MPRALACVHAVGEFAIDTPEYLHLSGSHRDQGILIVNGPGVRKGATVEGASIYDVTPTILRYLGEPLSKDMDGKPLDRQYGVAEITMAMAGLPSVASAPAVLPT